jgi:hypothetical protein
MIKFDYADKCKFLLFSKLKIYKFINLKLIYNLFIYKTFTNKKNIKNEKIYNI